VPNRPFSILPLFSFKALWGKRLAAPGLDLRHGLGVPYVKAKTLVFRNLSIFPNIGFLKSAKPHF
jgi:hypothetical protein